MTPDDNSKILPIKEVIVSNFTADNWLEMGLLTGALDAVQRHDRLLRSLHFGDDDYAGAALAVLLRIINQDSANLQIVEGYVAGKFGLVDGENISTMASTGLKIVFKPTVFQVPEGGVEPDLVAVMMPFSPEFGDVFQAISQACQGAGLRCSRVKDIWESQTIIQDVFALIFRASYVVCDYSTRNPNVFYEAGIAHTLGKHVIPLSQSEADVPFDVRHHRYLQYLNNGEGRTHLTNELVKRLRYLHMPLDLMKLLG